MKAYLFPGFDSLEVQNQRLAALHLPEVQKNLNEANAIIADSTGRRCDLQKFIQSDDLTFNQTLDLKIAASISVQKAVFERLENNFQSDDLIVGCSLGDLARSICSGIAQFQDVLMGGYQFGQVLMSERLGEIYKCTSAEAITSEELEKLLPSDLHLSVYQTPKHFLIAGPLGRTEEWLKNSNLSLRSAKMGEVPLHSPLMSSAADSMRRVIEKADIQAPKKRVFSSLWQKEFADESNCAQEISDNIVQKVDWVKTLKILVEGMGVKELVSVGPASTLLRFAERTPLTKPYQMTDGFAMLCKEMQVAL